MHVLGQYLPNEEISSSISRIYRQEVSILNCDVEVKSNTPPKRLASIELTLSTSATQKKLLAFFKETSENELVCTSLANKVMPYSSPRILWHTEAEGRCWMLLENIANWVNIGTPPRVNENMTEGLYEIHRVFLGQDDLLLQHFNTIPVASKDRMKSFATNAREELNALSSHVVAKELFVDWEKIKERVDSVLSRVGDIVFPKTLLHGNYFPSSLRGIFDSEGRVRVIAYDWLYSCIGYPQADLALLLDRIDIMANDQGLESPSPVLLQHYSDMLITEFSGVDFEQFLLTYEFCYICKILQVLKWWIRAFVKHPTHDPARSILEIKTKLRRLEIGPEGRDDTNRNSNES